jgi:hypothetical protein
VFVKATKLFADVGQQTHKAGPLDGGAQRSLIRGTGAGTLTAEQFALIAAHLFEIANIFEVNERRTRATFFGAKAAATLLIPSQLFADHTQFTRNVTQWLSSIGRK